MICEAIEALLRDRCTPAVVRAIEGGGDPLPLWGSFAEAGFLDLLAAESAGGADLPLPELYAVVALFGRHAVPLPLAQAIAARGLVAPGVQLPPGVLTLAPALLRPADGTLRCPLVPYGAIAQHVLAAQDGRLVLLACDGAERVGTGIVNSQAASLSWRDGRGVQPLDGDASALVPFAAALHAGLIAGAMARVFDLSLAYCNQRTQFGRTLGRFQAVQHQLSEMSEWVAAVGIAAEAAFQGQGRVPQLLAAAVAKARASEAAVPVANTAHALHGAIGVTAEYDLQLFTRRLHEWRIAHGSESHWHRQVGAQLLASGQPVAQFVIDAASGNIARVATD